MKLLVLLIRQDPTSAMINILQNKPFRTTYNKQIHTLTLLGFIFIGAQAPTRR